VLKLRLDERDTRNVKMGKELDKDVVCHRFYITDTASTLPRKLEKDLGT